MGMLYTCNSGLKNMGYLKCFFNKNSFSVTFHGLFEIKATIKYHMFGEKIVLLRRKNWKRRLLELRAFISDNKVHKLIDTNRFLDLFPDDPSPSHLHPTLRQVWPLQYVYQLNLYGWTNVQKIGSEVVIIVFKISSFYKKIVIQAFLFVPLFLLDRTEATTRTTNINNFERAMNLF